MIHSTKGVYSHSQGRSQTREVPDHRSGILYRLPALVTSVKRHAGKLAAAVGLLVAVGSTALACDINYHEVNDHSRHATADRGGIAIPGNHNQTRRDTTKIDSIKGNYKPDFRGAKAPAWMGFDNSGLVANFMSDNDN